MVENIRRKIRGKKEPGKRLKPQQRLLRPAPKQPEKNAQRDPGEKGRTCYYCGKREIALRHLSHPWLHVLSAKDHPGEETPS